MKKFTKNLRMLSVAAALALAIQPFASIGTPAQAGEVRVVPVLTESGSSGGWIIGGIFISVASIIACAMIVGAEEDREMTLEEALLSGAIPLGCLLREELGVSPE